MLATYRTTFQLPSYLRSARPIPPILSLTQTRSNQQAQLLRGCVSGCVPWISMISELTACGDKPQLYLYHHPGWLKWLLQRRRSWKKLKENWKITSFQYRTSNHRSGILGLGRETCQLASGTSKAGKTSGTIWSKYQKEGWPWVPSGPVF